MQVGLTFFDSTITITFSYTACTFRILMTSDVNIKRLATSASKESICKYRNIFAFLFCIM